MNEQEISILNFVRGELSAGADTAGQTETEMENLRDAFGRLLTRLARSDLLEVNAIARIVTGRDANESDPVISIWR